MTNFVAFAFELSLVRKLLHDHNRLVIPSVFSWLVLDYHFLLSPDLATLESQQNLHLYEFHIVGF